MEDRISSFAPVLTGSPEKLILGTMPSAASLAEGFYYAHPRNAFWPILSDVFSEARAATVSEKRALLKRNALALWDVARSCVRPGSLDSAIRDARPNDIEALLAREPCIKSILFNGKTAHALFLRLIGEAPAGMRIFVLPSTSPANTAPYEQKRAAWADALRG